MRARTRRFRSLLRGIVNYSFRRTTGAPPEGDVGVMRPADCRRLPTIPDLDQRRLESRQLVAMAVQQPPERRALDLWQLQRAVRKEQRHRRWRRLRALGPDARQELGWRLDLDPVAQRRQEMAAVVGDDHLRAG